MTPKTQDILSLCLLTISTNLLVTFLLHLPLST